MNLQKCSNGHYYDADSFQGCPHCRKTGLDENQTISLDIASEGGEVTVPVDEDATLSRLVKEIKDKSGSAGPSDDQKTVSYYAYSPMLAQKDPVVGWMVCTKGNLYGRDFRLKSGRNFVGRGEDMDVCLTGEATVSRDRHVILIYEPKQNVFLVQPGETKELVYLNDTVVLTPTVMKKNDMLQVGDITLMLIPCCDGDFTWNTEETE